MIVAKYKFDKSIYENLIPIFNDGYNGYTITDEIDSENSNYVIRTIECDSLPTRMRFGVATSDIPTNRELSLLEILELNTTELTSCDRMFIACQNVKSINTEGWTLNNVTNMNSMFYDCSNLTSLDVSNWDTSKVTDMHSMFNLCYKLISIDVSNFDTSEVTNMSAMFGNCYEIENINVSNFDTSNVVNMRSMFTRNRKLTSLDVSNWDTSKVTDMGYMFYECQKLTSLDVSNWDTSEVTNMYAMFTDCNKLTTLDISDFDTSKVTNMSDIFINTLSLQYIRCNNTSTINTIAPLLYNRTSSTQGKIITTSSTNVDTTTLSSLNWSIDTSSGTKIAEYKYDKSIWNYLVPEFNEGYSGYFVNDVIEDEVNSPNVVTREIVGYGGLPTLMRFGYNAPETNDMNLIGKYQALKSVSYVNATEITNMSKMFMYCSKMTDVTFDNMNKNTTTYSMFLGCTYLNTINNLVINNKTTIMYGMFLYCYGLTELDASIWDVSNVTNMADMFFYCTNLTTISGISNWNTGKVVYINRMFKWCENLITLDLSNWNTENATNIFEIFRACKKLTSMNLSNWNTSNVTNMSNMFYNCTNLTSLDVSNFDTNKVTDIDNMFYNCSKLSDIGMLYCSQDTINKAISQITDGNKTIWVKDTKASDYTATDYVTIKDYKEDNRTLYLNSPLLEGDEIVNKEGKLYHYHKMGMVVLDGSEDWSYNAKNDRYKNWFLYISPKVKIGSMRHTMCDTLPVITQTNMEAIRGLRLGVTENVVISLSLDEISNYISSTNHEIKQWLQENPTTVVYELAEPWYELISDDPLIVQSYTEGKLDTSSIITPTSIQSVPYEEELTYLYTSKQYCIQFCSTADCTVDITLGGTKVESKSVSVGLNKIYITTPSTLVDNKLIINAKGSATISKVVVVNSNTEFDYFDGLKSSFEDCLVTDVDNENYGKYEVGVRIVGKNKFDGELELGSINDTGDKYDLDSRVRSVNFNEIKSNTRYIISAPSPTYIALYDENKNFISRIYFNITNYNTFVTPNNVRYFKLTVTNTSNININVQLEEGSAATSYEPYKETNATIYLNSPLLQGDRIEVKDGKLCHYHKMGSVVLNGSESWILASNYSNCIRFQTTVQNCNGGPQAINPISDRFISGYSGRDIENIDDHATRNILQITISKSKLSTTNVDGFKQWLSENPTTVVYELAEPYYEDITPIQSSFVISTVSEGDMEILTDLPIKSNITYLTNITSAVLMEQQLDELDNGTESLTNIVEDEINE